MSTNRKWTDDEIQECARLFREGLFMDQVARRIGRSEAAIYAKMKQLGICLAERRAKPGTRSKFVCDPHFDYLE